MVGAPSLLWKPLAPPLNPFGSYWILLFFGTLRFVTRRTKAPTPRDPPLACCPLLTI